jgi:hypothetical protein
MGKLVLGHDDSFASPIERIFIATNGPESDGCNDPLRQGLSADLADGHRPNNVLGGIPTIALDYSPAWDAQLTSGPMTQLIAASGASAVQSSRSSPLYKTVESPALVEPHSAVQAFP